MKSETAAHIIKIAFGGSNVLINKIPFKYEYIDLNGIRSKDELSIFFVNFLWASERRLSY